MRTKEETIALMKEITQQINKMSNREYLDKMKEAMAYCREQKLLPKWDGKRESMQDVAYRAIINMELDKSSDWPMEKIRASLRMIDKKINIMSNAEYQEKVKEALAYCKEHDLMSQKRWENPDKYKLEYDAVVTMEMDKLLRHAPQEQKQADNDMDINHV